MLNTTLYSFLCVQGLIFLIHCTQARSPKTTLNFGDAGATAIQQGFISSSTYGSQGVSDVTQLHWAVMRFQQNSHTTTRHLQLVWYTKTSLFDICTPDIPHPCVQRCGLPQSSTPRGFYSCVESRFTFPPKDPQPLAGKYGSLGRSSSGEKRGRGQNRGFIGHRQPCCFMAIQTSWLND